MSAQSIHVAVSLITVTLLLLPCPCLTYSAQFRSATTTTRHLSEGRTVTNITIGAWGYCISRLTGTSDDRDRLTPPPPIQQNVIQSKEIGSQDRIRKMGKLRTTPV